MPQSLFIADLHLDPERPGVVALFERFLATRARAATHLYILGDLFEVWLGDDDDDEFPERVRGALRAHVAAGHPVSLITGNRDFLLGAGFAAATGLTLLPEPSLIEAGGQRCLILHGDSLCTDDTEYQRIRAQVRSPQWAAHFLGQPLAARAAFARQMRAVSKARNHAVDDRLLDANAAAATALLADGHAGLMIHGHTHRPGEHACGAGRRLVVGDWHDSGAVIAVVDGDGARLERYAP